MKKTLLYRSLAAVLILVAAPRITKANDGTPAHPLKLNTRMVMPMVLADTLPPPAKAATPAEGKPATATIKEVPKSHKQSVPVPVSTPAIAIKPVKIIKPKIVKPVIKVLH